MLEFFSFYSFVFLIGIFFGSFLNVVIDRLPFEKSILHPPSHCPHCKHRLFFIDLVPIVSFFYLKSRCRYCRAKISWYYPLVETITGLLFVLTAYLSIGGSIGFFLDQIGQLGFITYLLIIISIMIVIFFIDLKYGIIPFKIVFFALMLITVRYLLIGFADSTFILVFFILNYLLTAISIFSLFFLLFYFTQGKAIGFGDVFFSLMMGYLLGFPEIIISVYIAFLTGAIVSLILVVARRKRFKGGTIPFGPFLVFGTIISLFWGRSIIEMILSYLHAY